MGVPVEGGFRSVLSFESRVAGEAPVSIVRAGGGNVRQGLLLLECRSWGIWGVDRKADGRG